MQKNENYTQSGTLSPRKNVRLEVEKKDEKFMKNDFSVLDPIGYVNK